MPIVPLGYSAFPSRIYKLLSNDKNPHMRYQKLIFLLLLITLNYACAQQPSTKQKAITAEVVTTGAADTLAFSSGIKSIFKTAKATIGLEV